MQYGFISGITKGVYDRLDAQKIYIEFFKSLSGVDARSEKLESLEGSFDYLKKIFVHLALLKNDITFQNEERRKSFWEDKGVQDDYERINTISLEVREELSTGQNRYLKRFLKNVSLYLINDKISAVSHTNTLESRSAYTRFETIPSKAYKNL